MPSKYSANIAVKQVYTVIILFIFNPSNRTFKTDKPKLGFNLNVASVNKQKSDRTGQKFSHCLNKQGVLIYNICYTKNVNYFLFMSAYSSTKRAIKEDFDYTCQFCYQQFPANKLQIHHILRRRDGGTNNPNNLIPLCSDCHLTVHKHDLTHNSKGERIMFYAYIKPVITFERILV